MRPPPRTRSGIDSIEGTRDRARRAREFRALKIKVGGAEDLARLEAVRDESDVPFRVDANEGWTLETGARADARLIELGVEFVEQPFPADDLRLASAPCASSTRGRPWSWTRAAKTSATWHRPPPTRMGST